METDNNYLNTPVKPWYKKGWFIVLVLFLIIWFGVPLIFNALFPRELPTNTSNNNLNLPTPVLGEIWTTDDPYLGNSSAPIAIVEFGDFQCPFCKESEAVVRQLLAKYPDAIKLQFRDNPITDIHPEALAAAEAANCAGQQNKYWEYHYALYDQQEALGLDTYNNIAVSLGLDTSKFSRCLNGHLTLAEVKADYEAGQSLGVTGTPTFFVNGRKIAGNLPIELWDKIIPMVIQADLQKSNTGSN